LFYEPKCHDRTCAAFPSATSTHAAQRPPRPHAERAAPGRPRPVSQLAQHRCFAGPTYRPVPADGEIDPRLLLRERGRKATYLPVLSAWPRTKMVFQRVRPGEKLCPIASHSRAACTSPATQVWALDLVLLPWWV
jgi:5-formyltetrahydrofolate cyclo-ligase